MFHPRRRPVEPTAYEYNLQATEDHDEDHHVFQPAEKMRAPRGKRPNYKPTALTWPFILTQIVVLCIAIGLLVWAEKAMPDSDSTAIIDPIPSQSFPGRSVRAEFGKEFRRDNVSRVDSDVATTTRVDDQVTATSFDGTVSTESSDASTADPGNTAVTSGVTSADSTWRNKEVPTGMSETASNTRSSSSARPPIRTSGDVSSISAPSESATAPETSDSASLATSAGPTETPTDGTSTTDSASLGSTSRPSHSNQNGRMSTFVDPAAPYTSTSLVTSIFTSKFTTTAQSTINLTSTVTIPEHTTTFNVTRSTVIVTSSTGTANLTISGSTISTSYTVTGTLSSTTTYSSVGNDSNPVSTSVVVSEYTSVVASQTVVAPTTIASEIVETSTITSVTVFPTSSEVPDTTSETVIQTYVPYLSTGQTVITSVATVVIQPPQTEAKTQVPVTIVGTSVVGGQVYTIVETFAPQTQVLGDTGGVITQVSTLLPQTIVSQVGGSLTTNFIVVTPTPTTQTVSFNIESTIGGEPRTFAHTQAPQTIVTSLGGSLVTTITTPPPQIQITVVGGTRTTVAATSTSSGFQPISYVLTTTIGGSTGVIVATGAATRITTTINGTPTTLDTTLPPTTYTTIIGGTPVTQTTATTPTASDPITLTLVSTINGTPTTVIQTFTPTTYQTTISGRLTTLTSTPNPSTYLSTAPLTTSLYTTTSSTPTQTTSSPPAITSLITTTKTYNLTPTDYFLGTFLPALLTISLVIPLRIIDLNAKLYQPFNSLSSAPGGATGHDALTLQFTGLAGFLTPAATLLAGHPVPFITTLAVLAGSFMVALAVEAVSLKLHGHCSLLSSVGCAAALGVSPGAAHALVGVAGAVVVLLGALLVCLRGWGAGVRANPWSVAGIASLARNPDVRIRAGDDAGVRRAVGERVYGLGWFESEGREEYGIVLGDDGRGFVGGYGEGEDEMVLGYMAPVGRDGRRKGAKNLPFMTLRYAWRGVFVGYLLGLVVLIAYYDHTLVAQVGEPGVPHYTRFHLFFDSHSFGIRFLFAGLGVVITFCWQAFFLAVATIVPYHAMAYRAQPPEKSILVGRPTNAFSGIYLATRQRHAFYVLTSLMAILSEFLPILLSNIPHKLTQVLLPTLVCTRLSLACLAAMIGIVAWSFFIRWPPMPVDPRSVAGALWYVCESRMLADFAGLGEMDGKERDKRVREMGKRYYYGDLVGRMRIGVDCDRGLGDGIVTAYLGPQGKGLDPVQGGFGLMAELPPGKRQEQMGMGSGMSTRKEDSGDPVLIDGTEI